MSARVRVLLVCVLTGVLAACGGDSTGPSQANVAGAWMLSATNVSGQGLSCNLGPPPTTLNQSGTTFTGSYGPGTITCLAGGQSGSDQVQGTVVNGTINGNSVQFDLDTQDAHLTGSVNGNSM